MMMMNAAALSSQATTATTDSIIMMGDGATAAAAATQKAMKGLFVPKNQNRKESDKLFKQLDSNQNKGADHDEIGKFVASKAELWAMLSVNLGRPAEECQQVATRVAMELASGLQGQEALEVEITKDQFHAFRKQYILDPLGSQEFFHRAVFATFDVDNNSLLDEQELEQFLDTFYQSGSIFMGDHRLPPKDRLKQLILEKFDTNDDKKLPFEVVRRIISGELQSAAEAIAGTEEEGLVNDDDQADDDGVDDGIDDTEDHDDNDSGADLVPAAQNKEPEVVTKEEEMSEKNEKGAITPTNNGEVSTAKDSDQNDDDNDDDDYDEGQGGSDTPITKESQSGDQNNDEETKAIVEGEPVQRPQKEASHEPPLTTTESPPEGDQRPEEAANNKEGSDVASPASLDDDDEENEGRVEEQKTTQHSSSTEKAKEDDEGSEATATGEKNATTTTTTTTGEPKLTAGGTKSDSDEMEKPTTEASMSKESESKKEGGKDQPVATEFIKELPVNDSDSRAPPKTTERSNNDDKANKQGGTQKKPKVTIEDPKPRSKGSTASGSTSTSSNGGDAGAQMFIEALMAAKRAVEMNKPKRTRRGVGLFGWVVSAITDKRRQYQSYPQSSTSPSYTSTQIVVKDQSCIIL